MTLNKQLINLLGILLAVVVLVAGLALIAYPMFAQALDTDTKTRTVAQTNSVYQAQVDSLSAAEADSVQLDASLADLRLQIAATPKLDDVYEIVDTAAKKADVRVESVTADSEEAFVPRTQVDEDGKVVVEAPAPAVADDAAATDAGSDQAADAAAEETAPVVAPMESPQRQVLVTITIDVSQPYQVSDDDIDAGASADDEGDPADARSASTDQAQKAADLVDALGAGPRLLAPINVAYSDGKLTLSTLAFIRTEDAQ
ncbi:hypothetical protein [Microbacterium aurum]